MIVRNIFSTWFAAFSGIALASYFRYFPAYFYYDGKHGASIVLRVLRLGGVSPRFGRLRETRRGGVARERYAALDQRQELARHGFEPGDHRSFAHGLGAGDREAEGFPKRGTGALGTPDVMVEGHGLRSLGPPVTIDPAEAGRWLIVVLPLRGRATSRQDRGFSGEHRTSSSTVFSGPTARPVEWVSLAGGDRKRPRGRYTTRARRRCSRMPRSSSWRTKPCTWRRRGQPT